MATFDEDTYYTNKAAQLNASGYEGKSDWTEAEVQQAFADQGFTAQSHYDQFGAAEGVSPFASTERVQTTPSVSSTYTPGSREVAFNDDAYYTNKVNQLNATGYGGRTDWTTGEVADGMLAQGFTPQSHYEQFGRAEGVSPVGYVQPTNYSQVTQASTMAPGYNYVGDKSTVQNQLAGLLDSDSKYIQQARLRGEAQAAKSGLLNSSMAAGNAERVAIQEGLPIAAQDAGTYAAAEARQQQGDINSALNAQQYNAQGVLQSQGARQVSDLATQQGVIASDLAAQQGDITSNLSQQSADLELRNAEQMAAITQANNLLLTEMGLDAQAADRVAQTMATLSNTTLQAANAVLQNMEISNVPAAMEFLEGFLGSMELGQAIYLPDVDLTGSLVEA